MATPIITVDDIVVSEADAFATFTLRLSEASLSNVSVTTTNLNGTALNGSDFIAINQVVTWTPGQTVKTVQVSLINNVLPEGLENFTLRLSSAVGGIIGGDGIGWATIVDNDQTFLAATIWVLVRSST